MTHILTGSCATRTSSAVVESQMESPTSLWSLIGFYFLSWELNSPPDSELVSSVLSHILNLWCIFYVKSDVGWLDCWHRQCLCIKSWKYCISIQLPGNGWAVTCGLINGKRNTGYAPRVLRLEMVCVIPCQWPVMATFCMESASSTGFSITAQKKTCPS